MKFYFLLLFAFLFVLKASAQVDKLYITADDKYSNEPAKAVSYILIEKLSDSSYSVRWFDMHDSITMAGVYKDKQLSIPNGKFTTFKIAPATKQIKYNYNAKKSDTIQTLAKNYIVEKGFFVNGIKAGSWVNYYTDGGIEFLNTYHQGQLNGPYKKYNPGNMISIEGNYTDGLRSGTWYTYGFKGDTLSIDYYAGGIIKETKSHLSKEKFKSHLESGVPPYELGSFIDGKLSKPDKSIIYKGYMAKYTFTLTADGKLINPVVENVNNLGLDTRLVEVLINGPLWKPAMLYSKPIESKLTINIGPLQRDGRVISVYANMSGPEVAGYTGYYDGK
jgi:antitoxin component YwqK of YwqJK toxin-antitoxin module